MQSSSLQLHQDDRLTSVGPQQQHQDIHGVDAEDSLRHHAEASLVKNPSDAILPSGEYSLHRALKASLPPLDFDNPVASSKQKKAERDDSESFTGRAVQRCRSSASTITEILEAVALDCDGFDVSDSEGEDSERPEDDDVLEEPEQPITLKPRFEVQPFSRSSRRAETLRRRPPTSIVIPTGTTTTARDEQETLFHPYTPKARVPLWSIGEEASSPRPQRKMLQLSDEAVASLRISLPVLG